MLLFHGLNKQYQAGPVMI